MSIINKKAGGADGDFNANAYGQCFTWLDFDDASTLGTTSAGTTKINGEDEEAVYHIQDLSNYAWDYETSTQPCWFKTNWENGKNVCRFDFSQLGNTPRTAGLTLEYMHLFMIYEVPAYPATGEEFSSLFGGENDPADTDYTWNFGTMAYSSGSGQKVRFQIDNHQDDLSLYPPGQVNLGALSYMEGTVDWANDLAIVYGTGARPAETNPSNTFTGTTCLTERLQVGERAGSDGEQIENSYIGEIIAYEEILTGNNLLAVQDHLANKWGVSF